MHSRLRSRTAARLRPSFFQVVAVRHVHLQHNGWSTIFNDQWVAIAENYPHFGVLLTTIQTQPAKIEYTLEEVEEQLERLAIGSGIVGNQNHDEMQL